VSPAAAGRRPRLRRSLYLEWTRNSGHANGAQHHVCYSKQIASSAPQVALLGCARCPAECAPLRSARAPRLNSATGTAPRGHPRRVPQGTASRAAATRACAPRRARATARSAAAARTWSAIASSSRWRATWRRRGSRHPRRSGSGSQTGGQGGAGQRRRTSALRARAAATAAAAAGWGVSVRRLTGNRRARLPVRRTRSSPANALDPSWPHSLSHESGSAGECAPTRP
jgi:hypothetical protein